MFSDYKFTRPKIYKGVAMAHPFVLSYYGVFEKLCDIIAMR